MKRKTSSIKASTGQKKSGGVGRKPFREEERIIISVFLSERLKRASVMSKLSLYMQIQEALKNKDPDSRFSLTEIGHIVDERMKKKDNKDHNKVTGTLTLNELKNWYEKSYADKTQVMEESESSDEEMQDEEEEEGQNEVKGDDEQDSENADADNAVADNAVAKLKHQLEKHQGIFADYNAVYNADCHASLTPYVFQFINYKENNLTRGYKQSLEILVKNEGGTVVEQLQSLEPNHSAAFMINVGTLNERICKLRTGLLETNFRADVFQPSLILSAISEGKFDHSLAGMHSIIHCSDMDIKKIVAETPPTKECSPKVTQPFEHSNIEESQKLLEGTDEIKKSECFNVKQENCCDNCRGVNEPQNDKVLQRIPSSSLLNITSMLGSASGTVSSLHDDEDNVNFRYRNMLYQEFTSNIWITLKLEGLLLRRNNWQGAEGLSLGLDNLLEIALCDENLRKPMISNEDLKTYPNQTKEIKHSIHRFVKDNWKVLIADSFNFGELFGELLKKEMTIAKNKNITL